MQRPSVKLWHPELSNISEQAEIGDGTIIHSAVHIHDQVKIGKDCKIEAGAFIPNGVTIEDNVFIGPHVCFTNDKDLTEPFVISPTLIQKGAKIGANSTLRAGIILGEGSVIGAHSFVNQDVPAGEVWVGVPAKFLRKV